MLKEFALSTILASSLTLVGLTDFARAQTTSTIDLNATTSCIKGKAPPNDYAEVGQNLRESIWDQKGGVALVATVGGLKLKVLDPYGNSVCQDEANNTASCRFKVDLGLVSEFTILVINEAVSETVDYKLCAF